MRRWRREAPEGFLFTALAPTDGFAFDLTYTATGLCADLPLASFDQNVVHILSDDPSQSDYIIELSGIGIG